MIRLISIFCFIFFSFSAFGDQLTDSLELQLKKTKNKKKTVDLLNLISIQYQSSEPDRSYRNAVAAVNLAEEINYEEGIAQAYLNKGDYFIKIGQMDSALNNFSTSISIFRGSTNDMKTGEVLFKIGSTFYVSSNYKAALRYANEALEIYEIIDDTLNLATIHSLLCDIHSSMGYDALAIDHCLQSLRLYESLQLLDGRASLLNAIGNIYLNLKQFDKCNDFFNEALYISKNDGNARIIASSLMNIGNMYSGKGEYADALQYYLRAHEYNEGEKDIKGLAYSCYNIGLANRKLGMFEEALNNLQESLMFSGQLVDMELQAKVYAELGNLYSETGNYIEAIEYLKKSLAVAQKIDANPILRFCYNNLAKYYDELDDKENALIYFKLYMLHSDEMYSDKSFQRIAETEALYNLEKKEKQIQLLRSDNRIKDLEASEKSLMNIWLITGLIFVFSFSILVYRQYTVQNRANRTLVKQRDAIKRQKTEIESNRDDINRINLLLAEKNNEIIDSIEYAKRIQLSLLPEDHILKNNFDESFVLYLPKDIVSGDFYWHMKKDDLVYIAAVDCTGHGVPGAFMTVLANSLLNNLVTDSGKHLLPDQLILMLDMKVRESLNQHGIALSAFEGLDIALTIINKNKNEADFCGAKMPIYHFDGNDLIHIKGDRFSVGGNNYSEKTFSSKKINLNKGDILFLATDGYQDQFGGENDKKFMKSRFKNLLKTIAPMPLVNQNEKLISVYNEWKGTGQQTDDILIMGIKV